MRERIPVSASQISFHASRITRHIMHRFYLLPENCRGASLRLDGREAHHALHVLRVKRGERVTVLDGVGGEFLCEVASAAKDFLTLAVKETFSKAAPVCAITLLVAIPTGKIIEGIIQKSVELGANTSCRCSRSASSRSSTTTARRASARSGSRSPSRLSSNAARRGCRRWSCRRRFQNFWRGEKQLNSRSSVRCRRSAAIRVNGFWNFKNSTDVCQRAPPRGLGRRGILLWKKCDGSRRLVRGR